MAKNEVLYRLLDHDSVSHWATSNGFAPSTARKYAIILEIGKNFLGKKVINPEEQARLKRKLADVSRSE